MTLSGAKEDALAIATQRSKDLMGSYVGLVNDGLTKYQSVLTKAQLSALQKKANAAIAAFNKIYSQKGTVPIYKDQAFVAFFKKAKAGRLLNQRLENIVAAMDKAAESHATSFNKSLATYAKAGIAAKEKQQAAAKAKAAAQQKAAAAQQKAAQQKAVQDAAAKTGSSEPLIKSKVQEVAAEIYPKIYAQIAAQMPTASPLQIQEAAQTASMDYGITEVSNEEGGKNTALLVGGALVIGSLAFFMLRKKRR